MEDNNEDDEFNDSEPEDEVSYDSDASTYGSEQEDGKRKRSSSGNGKSPKRARNNASKRDSEEQEDATSSKAEQSTYPHLVFLALIYNDAQSHPIACSDLSLARSQERLV